MNDGVLVLWSIPGRNLLGLQHWRAPVHRLLWLQ